MPTRRRVLALAGAALCAGCAGSDGEGTDSPEGTTTTGESTESTDKRAERLLPRARDGWAREGDPEAVAIGNDAYRGVRAAYRSPSGVGFAAGTFYVSPMHGMDLSLEDLAERFDCAGWQVALPADEFVFAASSGVPERTRTPETVVLMESTPVAGTAGTARDLLALSPALTRERVERAAVGCDR